MPICEFNANPQIANMYKEKPIYAELSYRINGILFAVHNELGRYRSEKIYADAIENYLKLHKVAYSREEAVPITFPGEAGGRNKVDFLIDDKIILEIKAKRLLEKQDYYQSKRYLVASDKKLCILTNFRDKFLKPKRVLNSLVNE